ncbi:hypothetical protein FRB95_013769 [Tulasnella sp. JGI-2019a]|nr:hypothetical protein FRB95_013769 [Tulasnella sp. JGI-2019a]
MITRPSLCAPLRIPTHPHPSMDEPIRSISNQSLRSLNGPSKSAPMLKDLTAVNKHLSGGGIATTYGLGCYRYQPLLVDTESPLPTGDSYPHDRPPAIHTVPCSPGFQPLFFSHHRPPFVLMFCLFAIIVFRGSHVAAQATLSRGYTGR